MGEVVTTKTLMGMLWSLPGTGPSTPTFYTYRQSPEFLRVNLDFLSAADVDLRVGGNMMRLMSIDGT